MRIIKIVLKILLMTLTVATYGANWGALQKDKNAIKKKLQLWNSLKINL
jgi:hypothetical protein